MFTTQRLCSSGEAAPVYHPWLKWTILTTFKIIFLCYINTHLPSRLECQQRSLNWNTPFILDNLIGYCHPGDMLIKVLSWFCLERDRGGPSTCVQKLGSSLIQQASERQRSSLRWAPGQLFEIPEVLICLACQASSSWPCIGWDLICWLPAIFLPAILIPACASSSPAFLMMYSAY